MKILICDNDAIVSQALESFLARSGHKVHMVRDLAKAKQLFREMTFDLILLDKDFGLENQGLSMITYFKEDCFDIADWIPIIVMSNANDEIFATKAIDSGADFFITKPVSFPILKAKIQAVRRIASYKQNLIDFGKQLGEVNERLIASNQLLSELSLKDPLTMLANRRAFEENLVRQVKMAERDQTQLSLLMIDVDYFKPFNDTYGHQWGDFCLQKVAKAIQDSLFRSKDIAARYGGEEFSVILPETDPKSAEHIAERIRENVEAQQIKHAISPFGHVTISIGVVTSKATQSFSMESLIAAGDNALYEAKEKGRNTYCVAEDQLSSEKANFITERRRDRKKQCFIQAQTPPNKPTSRLDS